MPQVAQLASPGPAAAGKLARHRRHAAVVVIAGSGASQAAQREVNRSRGVRTSGAGSELVVQPLLPLSYQIERLHRRGAFEIQRRQSLDQPLRRLEQRLLYVV